ncbi:MAG: glycine oxidase ThiO [Planctomycetaceae bacterium]
MVSSAGTYDCVVVGGGVVGLSAAWELAGTGQNVAGLDQAAPGKESSWAGAGMLPPGNLAQARTGEERLRSLSHELWPQWAATLLAETGIDPGFRREGGLEIRLGGSSQALDEEIRSWHAAGVECHPLAPQAAQALEPALTSRVIAAYHLPAFGQVRNPRLLKALQAGCAARGVCVFPGTPAWQWDRAGARVERVHTPGGPFAAAQFVVAAGAWSEPLLAALGPAPWVRPMRGQIVLLNQPAGPDGPPLLLRPINLGHNYLVPRGDGRVLVGSTEEDVGYDRRNTAAGVAGLLELACQVAPSLATSTIERTWAGLRPRSIDGLPYLGKTAAASNVVIATGHFRAGLQLSPATARLVRNLVCDEPPAIPLEAFDPARVGAD